MKRLQEKEPVYRVSGEITAFLALLLLLFMTLVGALIESASIGIVSSKKGALSALAVESIFGEYQNELLDKYDILARFSSDEESVCNRMNYYGASGMSHDIEKIEYLTDLGGMVFYSRAVGSMKKLLGMEGISTGGEEEFRAGKRVEEEDEKVQEEMESLLAEQEESLPEEDNPLPNVERLKTMGILDLVVPKGKEVSNSKIDVERLPSHRELNKGNYGTSISTGEADKAFFAAYAAEHFQSGEIWFSEASELENSTEQQGVSGQQNLEDEKRTLAYEQEYLIGGKDSDRENLEAVCRKLLGIRMAANYAYLLTDTTKKAEAEAVAAGLCTLLTVPSITEIVKQAILLGWAYGESVVDVRALLVGKKVPLVKSSESWQLQLVHLSGLGSENEVAPEKDTTGGLSYQAYLVGLLLVQKKEVLGMRSLDLIEREIGVPMDRCFTRIEMQSTLELRRGVTRTFHTKYEY